MPMVAQHFFLFLIWVLYFFIHSFFASLSVKRFFSNNWFIHRNYRILYNLIAVISLVPVLYYQFNSPSIALYKTSFLSNVAAAFLILVGACVIVICLRKYFLMHIGVGPAGRESNELLKEGIHKYVRHPLYTGTLIFLFGILLIFPSSTNLLAYITLAVYTVAGTILEEQKLRAEYGEVYVRYSKEVPRFIPHLKKSYK